MDAGKSRPSGRMVTRFAPARQTSLVLIRKQDFAGLAGFRLFHATRYRIVTNFRFYPFSVCTHSTVKENPKEQLFAVLSGLSFVIISEL